MNQTIVNLENLIKLHSSAGRYSIYPSLKSWKNNVESKSWLKVFKENYNQDKGLNLYVHIPFCESLCTFCGCNIKVTKDYSEQDRYVDALITEFSHYTEVLGSIKLESIYFGGGSPNFLTSKNLDKLITAFKKGNTLSNNFFASYECDARTVKDDQLEVLGKHQFSRLIIGVQSFDEDVLRNVNRYQEYETIASVAMKARHFGISEIHFDLIYGLPLQTKSSLKETIDNLMSLSPEAVALYPLANAPWQNNTQRAYGQFHLPSIEQKYELFLEGNKALTNHGLSFLGMSHYYSKKSTIYKAQNNALIKRNVCGYHAGNSNQLIALGVSGIGHNGTQLGQKEKILGKYYSIIDNGKLPLTYSHEQTDIEKQIHVFFESFICLNKIKIEQFLKMVKNPDSSTKVLTHLKDQSLINMDEEYFQVSKEGQYFLRSICQALESQLHA